MAVVLVECDEIHGHVGQLIENIAPALKASDGQPALLTLECCRWAERILPTP